MSQLKNRLLKNSGITVLNENAEDKLKELEIKDRAQRIVSNFQREVLGLAQYIEKGCIYQYDREATPLADEVCDKYKKLVGMYLCAKVDFLKALVVDSFGETNDEEEKNDKEEGDSEEPKEVSVAITTQPPEAIQAPVEEKRSSYFPY